MERRIPVDPDHISEKTLLNLYNEHSGKISDKWYSFLHDYEQLLKAYRSQKVRILEIGIQNGGSLEIWAKYFPHAERIVGCDIDPKCSALSYADERISVVVGDANNTCSANKIFEISENFDIIIDDGSHESGDIIRTFARYFERLKPGGIFVVEDLHCSYWQDTFNGGLNAPFSSISFFKRLCDIVNYEHWGTGDVPAHAFGYFSKTYDITLKDEDLLSIEGVVFRNSLCAIYRADNIPVRVGMRMVGGKEAKVSGDPLFENGSTLIVPDQSTNPWGPSLGPSEQIVADVFEAQAREKNLQGYVEVQQAVFESQRTQLVLREKRLQDRLEAQQEAIELLQAQLEHFARAANAPTELIKKTIPILRNPIRSHLVTTASRWAALLPGLSEKRRQRFLRSAQKRDARALLEVYSRTLIDPGRTPFLSTRVVEAILQNDLDGIALPAYVEETDIDIVICIHNAINDVKTCLSSIIANTLPPYRLTLVDDGSRDDTKLYLEAFAAAQGAVLLRSDTAGGYTRAANRGLRFSKASWTVLLNSDTIVPFGWIGEMLKVGQSDPAIGIVGPASNTASWQSTPGLFNENGDWADNPLLEGLSIQDMQTVASSVAPPQGIELPFLNGFAFMIRRKLMDDIGIFDEDTFGAGYGEENDYCIRARKAGWKLVFAPNAYIYHAQSKSYSSEKRLKLAADADKKLNAKHDSGRDILPQVNYCKNSLATLSFRARFASVLEDISVSEHPHVGRRIALLCPIGRAGGGGNVLVQEAAILSKLGAQVWLINLSSNQVAFEETYNIGMESLYFKGRKEIRSFLQKNEMQFDAIVASAYFTTQWVPDHFDSKVPRLGYYIQDDEPAFFGVTAPEHQEALRSYELLQRGVGFTKTNWNADAIERRGFPRPAVVGASVDLSRFRPKGRNRSETGRVRIAAMLRFESGIDRRAPDRTMRVINRLSEAYGKSVELVVFGSDASDEKKSMLAPDVTDLGRLRPDQVAIVMRNIDIFLDFSIWQAMGLSAMEAMASGCAVVVPSNGGTGDFCVDQHNALIVDTRDDDACFAAASRLVDDDALLERLRQTATWEICAYSHQRSALSILDVLFGKAA